MNPNLLIKYGTGLWVKVFAEEYQRRYSALLKRLEMMGYEVENESSN
jgi:hypothetical protein